MVAPPHGQQVCTTPLATHADATRLAANMTSQPAQATSDAPQKKPAHPQCIATTNQRLDRTVLCVHPIAGTRLHSLATINPLTEDASGVGNNSTISIIPHNSHPKGKFSHI